MKTPKEKAKELFWEFLPIIEGWTSPEKSKIAKNLALVCATKIIESLQEYDENTEEYLKEDFGLNYFSCELGNMEKDFRYWESVRYELKKL